MTHSHEHELNQELLELEKQLKSLVPYHMSDDQINRMAATMAADSLVNTESSDDFHALEVHLEQLAPSSIPEGMIDRMVKAMDRWYEQVPVEEKIVSFGTGEDTTRKRKTSFSGGMLAAAAAMALLGAVTALVVPHFNQDESNTTVAASPGLEDFAANVSPAVSSALQPEDAWLVPDSLSHNVTNTTQQGVVMANDNTPHRCLRIEYVDRVIVQDDEGHEIEIQRPGVKYLLLPVETN